MNLQPHFHHEGRLRFFTDAREHGMMRRNRIDVYFHWWRRPRKMRAIYAGRPFLRLIMGFMTVERCDRLYIRGSLD